MTLFHQEHLTVPKALYIVKGFYRGPFLLHSP